MGYTNKKKEEAKLNPVIHRERNPLRSKMTKAEAQEDDRQWLENQAKLADYKKELQAGVDKRKVKEEAQEEKPIEAPKNSPTPEAPKAVAKKPPFVKK